MRQPEKAVDVLLEDLETWSIESISNEYFLMLAKSMITVTQAEKLSEVIEKCSDRVSA